MLSRRTISLHSCWWYIPTILAHSQQTQFQVAGTTSNHSDGML